ncbi:MAG: radical SAM protein [Planctomycetes bacterium]|nr:radical SAM protein [Planctomycetota bacterium]
MTDASNQESLQLCRAVSEALRGDAMTGAWADRMKGQPGVLVSGGPSLSRNGEVLADRDFFDRFVLVATAAAAGSLRAMELKPQLVAATAPLGEAIRQWLHSMNANCVCAVEQAGADCGGIGLPAPAGLVDSLLGHLLLRHLGCDPVVLVGFDLAFIDGVAHAKGNELDLEWSAQISPVRSWDWWHAHWIAGHSRDLRAEPARSGQSVLTNRELQRELQLLEAAFAQDLTQGLQVIDATEGGVAKRNVQEEALSECMARLATNRNPKMRWAQRTRSKASAAKTVVVIREAPRVAAVLAIDPARGGTGVERSLELEFGGRSVLRRTIDRLLQSEEIEHVCLVAPENWDHRAALEGLEPNSHLHLLRVPGSAFGSGHGDIRLARAWSDSCCRGGIANLSVYDEAYSAKAALQACEEVHANAALICGADWPLIAVQESWGVRGLVQRWREAAEPLKFVCSLAAVGVGSCLLPIESVRLLAGGSAVSIGQWIEEVADELEAGGAAKLGPIVAVPQYAASVAERLIMDTPRSIQRIRRALEPLLHGSELSALAQFEALDRHAGAPPTFVPQLLTIELNTGRRGCGLASPHRFGTLQRPTMTPKRMDRILSRISETRDVVVTLAGAGDPLVHPDVAAFAAQIRRAGALSLAVRSELLSPDALEKLAEIDPDVVTVDLHATNSEEYSRMMGYDRFDFVQEAIERVIRGRRREPGAAEWIARPWVLPRIERLRDMVDRIAEFGERWRNRAGGYCVDSPPQVDPWGDPIPDAPISAEGWIYGSSHQDRSALTVLSDGRVPARNDDLLGTTSVGSVDSEELLTLFRYARQHRARTAVKRHELLSFVER